MYQPEGGVCGAALTKRVPQDEGEFRYLLSLLAQLKQGRLSGALVQQVSNKGHSAPIILRYVLVTSFLGMYSRQGSRIVVACKAVVLLLLRSRCGGGGGLLGMLVMGRLLVHPRAAVVWSAELEVAVVRTRHHLGIGGAGRTGTGAIEAAGGKGRCLGVLKGLPPAEQVQIGSPKSAVSGSPRRRAIRQVDLMLCFLSACTRSRVIRTEWVGGEDLVREPGLCWEELVRDAGVRGRASKVGRVAV